MGSLTSAIAEHWLVLTIIFSIALFAIPWLVVWRLKRRLDSLRQHGLPATAKVAGKKISKITWDKSAGRTNTQGMWLTLEIHPDTANSYRARTHTQLHVSDMAQISTGMILNVRIDPENRQHVVITDW